MLIDITQFLIVSQSTFNSIIELFNCNLTINDPCYLITYLFANFLAYFFLLVFIWLVLYMYNKIFSSKRRWF